MRFCTVVLAIAQISITYGINVILTNDDGWAVAQIRAQKTALDTAGFSTVLSAPAENESGTGSSDSPAKTLTSACEFNSCPKGSPAEGFNVSDPTLNYVNSFPVTSVKFGIQTLAPKFFGGNPALVVSGPNIGNNLGSTVQASGTVGVRFLSFSALAGIPAVAFSGKSGSQVSFTTLTANGVENVYAAASVRLVEALIASGTPFLPPGIALNVNYPAATGSCASASNFKFVLTRILSSSSATDVTTCGTNHLPTESSILSESSGCLSSISVFNATGKVDVDAAIQGVVLQKLQSILTCS
ncbi:hypothetical protein M422DRAFT_151484 [Sphaerobolus stellatus SS14]|nr:hypothetical protein M422DRAFT_151484 [Sphaerobolus stellatus SS14]